MRIKGVKGELYFHVLQPNRELKYGDYRVVEPGSELKAKSQLNSKGKPRKVPMECQFGMHGCTTAASCSLEAFWSRNWICIVRLWGNVRTFNNKSAALRRKVVAMRQIGVDGEYPPSKWNGDQEIYDWVMAKPYKGYKGGKVMDQRTLDKILEYNRALADAELYTLKATGARKVVLNEIKEIADKAKLTIRDIEDALTPF